MRAGLFSFTPHTDIYLMNVRGFRWIKSGMTQGKYLSLTTTLQNTACYLHTGWSENPCWQRKELIRIQIFERTASRKRKVKKLKWIEFPVPDYFTLSLWVERVYLTTQYDCDTQNYVLGVSSPSITKLHLYSNTTIKMHCVLILLWLKMLFPIPYHYI